MGSSDGEREKRLTGLIVFSEMWKTQECKYCKKKKKKKSEANLSMCCIENPKQANKKGV